MDKPFAIMEGQKLSGEGADAAAAKALGGLRCIAELLEFIAKETREDDGNVTGAWVGWLGDRAGAAVGDLLEWVEHRHGQSL